ncbi:MAG: HD domain-containing protein [Candidatus Aenigmatarchaeota archaeon]
MNKEDMRNIEDLYEKGQEPIPAHSFENHVLEVYENAKNLIEEENVEDEVVEYAALLHDVGRYYPRENSHAEKGSEIAKKFLIEKLGKSKEFAEKVSECIRFHSNRPGVEPPSREAELVWVADKMHALGMTGLFRYLLSLGGKECSCEEAVNLLKTRIETAEERIRDFGFEELISGLDPIKKAVKKYEEENDASD